MNKKIELNNSKKESSQHERTEAAETIRKGMEIFSAERADWRVKL